MTSTIVLFFMFGLTTASAVSQNKPFIGMTNCSINANNANVTHMTVGECERDCGVGWHPYEKWEVLEAITTWSIPLFALVGNMQFSNFNLFSSLEEKARGCRRIGQTLWSVFLNYGFVALHLLGNPIDVIWSHLEKLDHMRQTRKKVVDPAANDPRVYLKAVAVICIILDDFDTSPKLSNNLREHIANLPTGRCRDDFLEKCRYSAAILANTRTRSTRRAALAVIAYVVALYTSIGSAMARDQLPVYIPHTIALREIYYWLIFAIALSSAAGAFPTDQTAKLAIDHIMTAVEGEDFTLKRLNLLRGANYGYRPQKHICLQSVLLLGISFLAVGGAWAFSFTMSWLTPARGLGCRSFLELAYFLAWVLNFFISYFIARIAGGHPRYGSYAFLATLTIDALIAVPSVLCLFIAFKGWFNSCKCWAAAWTLPKVDIHYIPIGLSAKEHDLAPTYYGLIGGAVGLQLVLSAVVLWYYYKELRLIYGSPRIEGNGDAAQTGESQSQHVESGGDRVPNGDRQSNGDLAGVPNGDRDPNRGLTGESDEDREQGRGLATGSDGELVLEPNAESIPLLDIPQRRPATF